MKASALGLPEKPPKEGGYSSGLHSGSGTSTSLSPTIIQSVTARFASLSGKRRLASGCPLTPSKMRPSGTFSVATTSSAEELARRCFQGARVLSAFDNRGCLNAGL